MLDFNLFYNHFVVLIKEEKLKTYVYKIKPDFELIYKLDVDDIENNPKIEMGPGRILIHNEKNIYLYNFDEISGMTKVDRLEYEFVHYYKNILVVKENKIITLLDFLHK